MTADRTHNVDSVIVELRLGNDTFGHAIGMPRHDGTVPGRLRDGTPSLNELRDCVRKALDLALEAWNAKRLADIPWVVTRVATLSAVADAPSGWRLVKLIDFELPYAGLVTADDVRHPRVFGSEVEARRFAEELNRSPNRL